MAVGGPDRSPKHGRYEQNAMDCRTLVRARLHRVAERYRYQHVGQKMEQVHACGTAQRHHSQFLVNGKAGRRLSSGLRPVRVSSPSCEAIVMTHKKEMPGHETALNNFEILSEENGNARAILHREIPTILPKLRRYARTLT